MSLPVATHPRCKKGAGHRHNGAAFTCRACGGTACSACALHFWRERALPEAAGGLDAQKRAWEEAVAAGLLLGTCSEACRTRLPRAFGRDFVLEAP